jgi:methionyl-tRNA formyltransferase
MTTPALTPSLKTIFMGTPDFAVPALQRLIESHHQVVAVYAQPPRPKGRGQQVQNAPTHDVALAQQFARRIVGLRAGQIVFDGTAETLGPAALTAIYGEEDWSRTIRQVDEDETEDAEA